MAESVAWSKLKGIVGKAATRAAVFFIGYDGAKLTQDTVNADRLLVQNNAGSTDLGYIETGTVDANTKVITPQIEVENSTDKTVITREAGGTASVTFTLPNQQGSNEQVLTENGSGVLSWTDKASAGFVSSVKADITFESSSSTGSPPFTTLADFDTLGIKAFVERIVINIQTVFTTTGTVATLTLGITSDPDKFAVNSDIDLTTIGTYVFIIGEYVDGDAGSENIGYNWQKNDADAGEMTVIVYYSVP